ncbi:TonB-dependent receptor [Propionivibrio dicarboxylicus]|uniref:Phosphate-selective porin O and P n=1 Tax=Propionivibrio dicarboxylicus TaxID=83767 RepID=A0A1G8ENR9_9RHOO|nr:TonB-dependent receptor [Propionivibrio dicarboxylicus]SDH71520.1 hypothetical protein SAMN05660652_02142 [Propionivibrio dicarboxylicus]
MRLPKPLLAALALAPTIAIAADNDLQTLREEVARMRESYEKRIQDLENRLAQAETKVSTTEAKVAESVPQAPVAAPVAGTNAFNPDVSLILSGQYSNLSKDSASYRITGFHLPNDTLDGLKANRGLSLTESELGISANIDHLFYGAMLFSIHPDNSVSTEEAFIQTTALPYGLTLKAGRHYSGIGYLNEQHAHTWDFVDSPLAYRAFLGGQFGSDGVQMRWLAPTDTFIEIGAELGRGANYPGTDRNKNGAGSAAVFAHLGGDVGISHSWRAGLSYLGTSARDRKFDELDATSTSVTNSFAGNSRLLIADGVWKWAPNGNASVTNFKLQGEYLRRTESGDLTYDTNAASLGTATGHYSGIQSGWYLQGVYQFAPKWRVGLRAERLSTGAIDYGVNSSSLLASHYAPSAHALMFDYNPSEFSRIRLQFAQDKSREGITDNQIFLQYQMSLGAHGAHKF